MMKSMFSSFALAALLLAGASMPGAATDEKLSPRDAYDKALNECAQLDNPDRRQQCREKAEQQFEQAQKSGDKHRGMEKQKQY